METLKSHYRLLLGLDKDYFRWFWAESDAIAGREFFDHCYNWAIRSRLEPMKKVTRILSNRLDNILSWFRQRLCEKHLRRRI
ncbi:MAG: transposase [Planctomyces sp.]|nr:transposase [Planctomyces sp.]